MSEWQATAGWELEHAEEGASYFERAEDSIWGYVSRNDGKWAIRIDAYFTEDCECTGGPWWVVPEGVDPFKLAEWAMGVVRRHLDAIAAHLVVRAEFAQVQTRNAIREAFHPFGSKCIDKPG